MENIMNKFATKYDELGFANYIGFTYLTEKDLDNINYKTTKNNYIGVNEIVLTSTVNRCFEEIYNLQVTLQNLIKENSINIFPLVTQTIDLDI